MFRALIFLLFSTFCQVSLAQDLTLQNLNQDDLEDIVGDFSAVFNHTTVSGAGSLGNIFGFELGLVGGLTKTPKIDSLADESGTDQKADTIPHAELIGLLTVPAGITVDVGMLPKVGNDEFKFSSYSLGVKWTPTDILLDWPLSVAIKGQMTKTDATFKQDIQTVPTTFDYKNTITAFTLLVSKNFVLVEPYVGYSLLSAKGELDVTGSTQVFDAAYTTSQSASAKKSSSGFVLGAELKLLVFKAGLEYAHLFDTNRYSAKLAFYF